MWALWSKIYFIWNSFQKIYEVSSERDVFIFFFPQGYNLSWSDLLVSVLVFSFLFKFPLTILCFQGIKKAFKKGSNQRNKDTWLPKIANDLYDKMLSLFFDSATL